MHIPKTNSVYIYFLILLVCGIVTLMKCERTLEASSFVSFVVGDETKRE